MPALLPESRIKARVLARTFAHGLAIAPLAQLQPITLGKMPWARSRWFGNCCVRSWCEGHWCHC